MLNSAEHETLPANKQKITNSTVVFLLSLAECEIFYAYEYENANNIWHFRIYQQRIFLCSAELSIKKFYNLGASLLMNNLLTSKAISAHPLMIALF